MIDRLCRLVNTRSFTLAIIALIIISSLIIGLQTYDGVWAKVGHILGPIDTVILWLFVLEIAARLVTTKPNAGSYFGDGWNLFDFVIVVVSVLPLHSEAVSVFRLVRVLRALRLLKAIPGLQVIVNAMIRSVASLGHVGVVLLIHFYMYGVVGTKLLGPADPETYGTLDRTFLSLFEVVTLEGWVEMMDRQPEGIAAPLYFVSFIVLGTMIIMNLVIGVIINSMMESQKEVVSAQEAVMARAQPILEDFRQLELRLESMKQDIVRLRRQMESGGDR